MGLKSAWNEIVRYNKSPISKWASDDGRSVRTPRQQVLFKTFLGAVFGVGGMLINGISTNFQEDPAAGGEQAGQAQIAYYNGKFEQMAETWKTVKQLNEIVEKSKIDVLLETAPADAQEKSRRATVKVQEYRSQLSDMMDALAKQIVTDKNLPENDFDAMVKKFNNSSNDYLPSYLYDYSDFPNSPGASPWDSRLRECQVKFSDADGKLDPGKAEAVAACTGDQVFSKVVAPGFGVGSGLFFAWILAMGPALAARHRRASQDAAQNDKITTSLKITYETPKKG